MQRAAVTAKSNAASAPAPDTRPTRRPPARETVRGNQAALRTLRRQLADTSSPAAQWGDTAPQLQPKLEVGAVDDPLEHEADRVADQVMRMPDAGIASAAAPLRLSRKCTACENEEKLHKANTGGPASQAGTAAPVSVHGALAAPGAPLDSATRAFFEPRFGRDFGAVRVHADAGAAQSARDVGALAYTVGRDIVFDAGQFQPHEPGGRRLLAHELAHVVQQGAAAGPSAMGAPTMRRTSAAVLQRAKRKGCIAPSFVVDVATASAFGHVAETLIEQDYLRAMGGVPFGNVFLDNALGPMSYVAFLAAHHPSLDIALLALQISLSGGVLVPDILDTRTDEFYDVKPDSPDGRAAGRGKLAAIDAFMSFNSLPYTRGTAYTPTPSIPIPLGGAALTTAIIALLGPAMVPPAIACGIPDVTLAPQRIAPGLLAYEICVEADLDCYLKVMALEALIAIVILAVLALIAEGGGIPIPAPEPVPVLAATQSPAPVPAPAAAPAPAPMPAAIMPPPEM